jgi:hypothetical protein
MLAAAKRAPEPIGMFQMLLLANGCCNALRVPGAVDGAGAAADGDGAAVVPLKTSQALAVPGAGSRPKNELVHWPLLETLLWTHWDPAPYRTCLVPLKLNVRPSLAIRDQDSLEVAGDGDGDGDGDVVCDCASQVFETPGAGSRPKNEFVHWPLLATLFSTHCEPAP